MNWGAILIGALIGVLAFVIEGLWKSRRRRPKFEPPPGALMLNELREQLFAASRRLGVLKQEYARRQREARRFDDEKFRAELDKALKNPNQRMFHRGDNPHFMQ